MTRAEEWWLIDELGFDLTELSPPSELVLAHDLDTDGLGLRELLESPEKLAEGSCFTAAKRRRRHHARDRVSSS